MKKLLKKLCLAFGPSGLENRVRLIIEDELSRSTPEGAEIIYDNIGGIYLHIKNEGAPRLMINAHMDEVGFMVTSVTDRGTVKFGCVGGINPLTLSAKRVIFENGTRGAIMSKPIHLLSREERNVRTEVDDMYVDIGATSKENALEYVNVGDYFTFDSDFVEMGGGAVKAKALDDRHGCCIMLRVIKALCEDGKKSPYDLYFAFTTREEIGLSGAWCASEIVKPDYAIVIESKAVLNLPGIDDDRCVGVMGEGALISYADGGAIMDRYLTDKLISICQKNEIKYQISRAVSGGNDSANIQVGARGAKVALISAPSRYIHSPSSVVSLDDLEQIYKAIYAFVTDNEA